MPLYFYRATDSMGKIIEGNMEAQGENLVVDRLHTLGYIPIKIGLPGEGGLLSRDIRWDFFFRKVSRSDVLGFTQGLATLLNAGLPMDRSLSIFVQITEKQEFKKILGEIVKDVEGGSSLAVAVGKHPKVFSKLYVNMVRAGETGGFLTSSLNQLVKYLGSAQDLRNYIISAMIYPIILSAVGGISVIILLTFVVPRFAQIFSHTGTPLPLPTQILLGFSSMVRDYWWAIMGLFGACYWGFKRYTRTDQGGLKWDRSKLKWILVGNLIKKIEVSRFSRTLGTLIKSGIPILSAINIVQETLGNKVISRSMDNVHKVVKEGGRMSEILGRDNLFPLLAVHMVMVGEESGNLDDMLLHIADNYENEVRTDVKRLVSLLEPAMILFMGMVVGFIVISILLAIFSVNEMPF